MKNKKDIFLSIIVPVYNVQKYLKQCVESIINQNQNDIELILIDDGSTDYSGDICDEFSRMYNNVKAIHQKNQGLGGARNTGYRNASGRYIWYVDSDDFITANAIEWIKEKLVVELDILLFLATSFSDDAKIDMYYSRKHSLELVTTGKQYLESAFRNDEYITSVCLRVYRRQFLEENGLLFGKEELHEDELYSFISLLLADRVMATDVSLYMRRYRQGSKIISASECTGDSFIMHYNGYKVAIDGLLSVYDTSITDEIGRHLILKQVSKYYQYIFGRYITLEKDLVFKYKGLIDDLNLSMFMYKSKISFLSQIMMNWPWMYRKYKIAKNRLLRICVNKVD